jgi:hypothetical protein
MMLTKEESREWHDGPAWFRADLKNAAEIKAYHEASDCNILDYGGFAVFTAKPASMAGR